MSDTITFHSTTFLFAYVNFQRAAVKKHTHFPFREDDLQRFSECRQKAKDLGASEKTLDDYESYLKKCAAGVSEFSEDGWTKFMELFVKDIIDFQVDKAVEAGKKFHYIEDH